MKVYQDSRGMDPLISSLGNRCRLEVSFTKGPFTLGGEKKLVPTKTEDGVGPKASPG